jgi:hypothetical protein
MLVSFTVQFLSVPGCLSEILVTANEKIFALNFIRNHSGQSRVHLAFYRGRVHWFGVS